MGGSSSSPSADMSAPLANAIRQRIAQNAVVNIQSFYDQVKPNLISSLL